MNYNQSKNIVEWLTVQANACYNIWYWRNLRLHVSTYIMPQNQVHDIQEHVKMYHTSLMLQNKVTNILRVEIHVRWKSLEIDRIDLNSDGAV